MVYTPVGPFVDSSATPPISAAFLNTVESTLVSVNPISAVQTFASGATFTITLPSTSAGLVVISGSAGGAWFTGYVGAYVTSTAGAIITQLALQNHTPGNLFTSVTASLSSLNLTVVTAATGSNSTVSYVVQRSTP